MTVFHIDIEAFLTNVERVKNPALSKRPLVIAPQATRATVIAASSDAKALGIKRGMPLPYVQKTFPGVHIQPPNDTCYDRAHRYILQIVHQYCPIVEPVGYGHIALDMSGTRKLYGSFESAALKLAREIRDRARLESTVGIAANKLVSTIAAKEIQKHREPLHQVNGGSEVGFLGPLTCKALPEWEERHVKRFLFELNLRRIGQVQAIPRDLLSFAAGAIGGRLHRHAHGIDSQPVIPPRQARQLTEEHYFQPDTNHDGSIRATLYRLLERLCYRLRAKGLAADRAGLQLRFSDDVRHEVSCRFEHTQQEQLMYTVLKRRFEHWYQRRQRLRHVRLILSGLCPYHHQESLFEPPKGANLSIHLDRIRNRFGEHAIQSGRGLDPERKAS